MLGFDVPKESYVATATAVGLIVDLARLPVYLAIRWRRIVELWPLLLLATMAVVFRRAVAGMLLALGTYMLVAVRG